MDCCGLSSTGLQNIDANELTADNATIFSNLNISGYSFLNNVLIKNNTTLLSSLNVDGITTLNNTTNINGLLYVSGTNILQTINNNSTNLNNINVFINDSSSGLNITGATNINFNVGTQLTTINLSGLSVFHNALETFPYNYAGVYNVGDRFNNLYHVMADSPDNIINFDATHNTVIRIREQDIVNQINYPRQFQVQTYQGTTISKFDVQGLQVLDKYKNWYYINKLFTSTGNSLFLASDNIKVDSEGQLNVQNIVTNYILGIASGTVGTWLNVKDGITNSISGVSSLTTKTDNILANLASISGSASNIANVANYYSGLQSSIAVTNGVVSTAGLVLAFDLKQDRFDVKAPFNLRNPNTPAITTQEYFKQLELKINPTLLIDSGILTINTREFLTPTYGDLAMVPTPDNISTSSSMSYVVVKNISQPMTCMSSLNVSGYTTLINNVTCMSSLNVNGYTTLTNDVTFKSSLNVSGYTTLINNVTCMSSLNVNDYTTLIKKVTCMSSLNVGGAFTCDNIYAFNSTVPSILFTTSQTIFNTPSSSTLQSILLTTSTTIFNTPSSSTAQSIILTTGGTILNNQITAASTFNVVGNIFAANIANQTPFTIVISTPCIIGSKNYFKYDIDLTKYTSYINPSIFTQTRKFKFMCSLTSGAHNAGLYSLNYDIDYSYVDYNPAGPQGSLAIYNGLNAIAYGFPYPNHNMNQITPNGLFIWKNTFNYITIYSLNQINLHCLIIDYLS